MGYMGRGVQVFDEESSPSHGRIVGNGPSRHVKVQGTDDVDAALGLKQPELSPEPRVEVDQLEASVPLVVSPVEIDDSPEPQRPATLRPVRRACRWGLSLRT